MKLADNSILDFESALVVLVPEAEELVGAFREKYDPVASEGVAAHITINYPFQVDPKEQARQIENLRAIFSRFEPFHCFLSEICCFPTVIYLKPEPEQLFKDLADAVVTNFPESLPYEGKFGDVVPHLTVAEVDDKNNLDKILQAFTVEAGSALPIRAQVTEVQFMDNRKGVWETREEFPLLDTDLRRFS